MAFPTVVTTATSTHDANNSISHAVTLASGIVSGDLILIGFATDGNPTVSVSAAYTIFFNQPASADAARLCLMYRQADGGEGATATVRTSLGERTAHFCYRITGHQNPATQAPEASANTQGLSTQPDPASLTPTGGAKDYLWLAVEGHDRDQSTDSIPASYATSLSVAGGGANSAGIGSARRALNAASENPGTFAISGSDQWAAVTVAVHPSGPVVTQLNVTANSVLHAQGLQKLVTANAALQKISTLDVNANALLLQVQQLNVTANGILQALDLALAVTANSVLQSQGNLLSVVSNAILSAIAQLDVTANAVLQQVQTKAVVSNAVLQALAQQLSVTSNAILQAVNQPLLVTANAFLASTGIQDIALLVTANAYLQGWIEKKPRRPR